MKLLFKVEEVFEISGRGCVIVPVIADGADFSIKIRDAIQLRTPAGAHRNTCIDSVELLVPVLGTRRMALFLPPDVHAQDAPKGTEVWLTQGE